MEKDKIQALTASLEEQSDLVCLFIEVDTSKEAVVEQINVLRKLLRKIVKEVK